MYLETGWLATLLEGAGYTFKISSANSNILILLRCNLCESWTLKTTNKGISDSSINEYAKSVQLTSNIGLKTDFISKD